MIAVWRSFSVRNWSRLLLIGALLALIPSSSLALPGPSDAETAAKAAAGKALRDGDRGDGVAALQRLLREAGFDPVKIDGIFGPLTEGAVRKAQAAAGLKVDGLAGRETVAALRQQSAGEKAAQPSAAASPPGKAVPAMGPAPKPAPAKPALVFFAATEPQAAPAPEPVKAPVPAPKPFALTFNGAPDPQLTPLLLETLKRHGMQATFFIQGEAAEQSPGLLRQIAAAGHEIGSNGYTSLDMTLLTEAAAGTQMRHARRVITEVVGEAPRLFRPPQGRFNSQLAALAHGESMELVLWTNVTIREAPESEPGALAGMLAEQVYPGAVLMLHQDRPDTVRALDSLLKMVREQGYVSVGLSGLITAGN